MRIGAGTSASVLRSMQQANKAFDRLAESALKLSTLKKINRASDDPSGLIAAEQIRAELREAEVSLESSERIRDQIQVADSGLAEASSLVNELRGNVALAASDATSPEEREALQIEIDAAIDALDHIGATTSYGGRRVLNGDSINFRVSPHDEGSSVELIDLQSGSLGGDAGRLSDLRSGGSASLEGDLGAAIDILDAAHREILGARARGGAFEKTVLTSTENVLEGKLVELSKALSHIEDVDVAAESANFARAFILADNAALVAEFTMFSDQAAAGLLDGLFDQLA